ncbi:hypothetical protein TI39_contig4229g00005 [Zymoseptoria brevis]|uniref:Uncharacterized protein n=1 Tax=Zymoseptoria brevis TaxID=1047168 RepID=A0A0F4GCT1_9PEZI|nr:hypothetical protein TI39_contig4229g00005 [Zymoseptoria brevis]
MLVTSDLSARVLIVILLPTKGSVLKTLAAMPNLQKITFMEVKFRKAICVVLPCDAEYVFFRCYSNYDCLSHEAKTRVPRHKIDLVGFAKVIKFVAALPDNMLETEVVSRSISSWFLHAG